jgi:hypothetical protein
MPTAVSSLLCCTCVNSDFDAKISVERAWG